MGCFPGEYQHLPWSQLKQGLKERKVTENPSKPNQSLHETVLRWVHITAAAQWQKLPLYEYEQHSLGTGVDNIHADLSYDNV